jgi:excisionase family DNA binding protein
MRTGIQMATTREVAALLRLKESTVCSLVSKGRLPGYKVGKSWRFDLEKIEGLFPGYGGGRDRPTGNEFPEG